MIPRVRIHADGVHCDLERCPVRHAMLPVQQQPGVHPVQIGTVVGSIDDLLEPLPVRRPVRRRHCLPLRPAGDPAAMSVDEHSAEPATRRPASVRARTSSVSIQRLISIHRYSPPRCSVPVWKDEESPLVQQIVEHPRPLVVGQRDHSRGSAGRRYGNPMGRSHRSMRVPVEINEEFSRCTTREAGPELSISTETLTRSPQRSSGISTSLSTCSNWWWR